MSERASKVQQWYLVYAKPRQETVARLNLERQGYGVYLPLVRQPRRHKGRMTSVVAPMFPRYLFIRLDTQTDNWGPIRSTFGVVSIVRFGQSAAAVPDDLIALLRSREDDDGIQVLPVERYRRGTKIRITDGGFAGYEGIFVAHSARDRVTVLLQVLGRHTRASIDLGAIEPAS
jgi:transcriptional antiterminator RfaH